MSKYKGQMVGFMAATLVMVVVQTIRPYWLKGIMDKVALGDMNGAMTFLALFGVSTIGGNLLSAATYYLGDKVLIPMSKEIREVVFKKVLDLDFAYHVEKNTGSLISAFRRGDGAVFSIFQSIFNELIPVVISLVITLIFLYQVKPSMAGSLLLLFVFNMGLIWWLVKKNLNTRSAFNKSDDAIAGIIADSMLNYETVKFFAAEKKEQGRLGERFQGWLKDFWAYSTSFRVMDVSIGTTSGLGIMFILYLAVSSAAKGEAGLGDLVMVSGFITGFYYQFFNLFFRVRDIAKNAVDLEKYFGILDNEVKVKDPSRRIKLSKPKGEIKFEKISFNYPKGGGKILDDIDLIIEKGKQTALVGRSGAGKTTLIKLLLRFYDPSSGVIKFDGVDIKKMSKSYLRSLMAVVPQEPIMFNNTIEFNLTYGKTNATKKEMELAAKDANIFDFVEQLPDKWQTQVGERGIKLSGGQKQRLAIARALLTNPKVLIFDEATSNLDSESEKQIQTALARASKNRTVVVIAHRFSTIRNADKIVVLSSGSIAESGKHEELLEKKGIYNMLWTMQVKGKMAENESLVES